MPTFNSRDRGAGGAPGRRTWALVIGLAVVALAVAGCGGSSNPTSSSTQRDKDALSRSVPSQITLADDQVVKSLDPIVNSDYEYGQLTLLWGGFLTHYGSGQPELAATLSPSNNFKAWTVNLQTGVKFSNGAPVTSQDVVASFERLAKMKAIESDFFAGAFYTNLSSVTAKGDSTVIVNFKVPFPDFAKQVSMPDFVILPASGISQGASFWKHPISAGRYQVQSADLVNGNFTLSVNPNYPGTLPKVKVVVVKGVPDPATRLAQLKSGEIDYAENLPGNYLPQITGKLRVDPAPWFGGSLFLAPNVHKGQVLSDVRIRQAINLAINREQISRTALGGDIAGRPLYGIPWSQDNSPPNVAPFPQDLAKAMALLKGTACENGCTIKTIYWTDAVWQLPVTIQVVAQQLKQIGINLQLDGIPVSAGSPYTQPGWQLAMNFGGEYDNSPSTISAYFITGGWEPTSTGFSDPAMTAFGQQMAVAGPSQLPALAQQSNKLFAQNMPVINLTTLTYLAGTSLPASVLTNTGAAYFDIG